MEHPRKIAIALAFTLSADVCFAAGVMKLRSYAPDGAAYEFKVRTGTADRWNSERDEYPPLSPKKAKDLATDFMMTIPAEGNRTWSPQTVTLRRTSHSPEEWVYCVTFRLAPNSKVAGFNGAYPGFNVAVRMDATIPTPEIKRNVSKKRLRPGPSIRAPRSSP